MILEIKTIEDVALFASQLVNKENLNFHPDDDFSDYINLETQESLYSEKEIQTLNQQMKKCFDVCNQFGTDIYVLMGQPLFERMKIGDFA
ncbi:MAG TPA: hypothetical protein VIK42_00740 [Bacteroidales bacterium]